MCSDNLAPTVNRAFELTIGSVFLELHLKFDWKNFSWRISSEKKKHTFEKLKRSRNHSTTRK